MIPRVFKPAHALSTRALSVTPPSESPLNLHNAIATWQRQYPVALCTHDAMDARRDTAYRDAFCNNRCNPPILQYDRIGILKPGQSMKDYAGHSVINLSNITLTEDQTSALAKGLTFVPDPLEKL